MLVYIVLISWVLLCNMYYAQSKNHQKEKFFFFLVMGACTLLIGLHSTDVGVDTANYEYIYNQVSQTNWSILFCNMYFEGLEIGYVVLMKLCSCIFDNYYFFQFVQAILIFFFFYHFLKLTKNKTLSFLVFLGLGFFLFSFNIARQMLAVSITSYSWALLQGDKNRKAFLFLFLAVLIHNTSAIFLAAYLIKYASKWKWFFWIFPFLVILLMSQYGQYVEEASGYLDKYNNYYNNHKDTQVVGSVYLLWIVEVTISTFVLYTKNFNQNSKITASLCVIAIACNVIGMEFNYFERLGMCFYPFFVFLFDDMCEYLRRYKLNTVYKYIVGFCFVIYFLMSAASKQYIYSSIL